MGYKTATFRDGRAAPSGGDGRVPAGAGDKPPVQSAVDAETSSTERNELSGLDAPGCYGLLSASRSRCTRLPLVV